MINYSRNALSIYTSMKRGEEVLRKSFVSNLVFVLCDHDGNNYGNDDNRLKEEEWQDVFDFLDLNIHFVKKINVVSSVKLV